MRESVAGRLLELAIKYDDPVLSALVASYQQQPYSYDNTEIFLLEVIETLAMAHQMSREAFAEHLTKTPPTVYVTEDQWRDMNS